MSRSLAACPLLLAASLLLFSQVFANVIFVSDGDQNGNPNAAAVLGRQLLGGTNAAPAGQGGGNCAAARDARTLLAALAGTLAGGGLNQGLSREAPATGAINAASLNALGFNRGLPTATLGNVLGQSGGANQPQLFSAIQEIVSRNSPNQGLTQPQVRALNRLARNGGLNRMLIEAMLTNQQRMQQLEQTINDQRTNQAPTTTIVRQISADPPPVRAVGSAPPSPQAQQTFSGPESPPPMQPPPRAGPCCQQQDNYPPPDPQAPRPQYRRTQIVGLLLNPGSLLGGQPSPFGGPSPFGPPSPFGQSSPFGRPITVPALSGSPVPLRLFG